MRTWLRWTLIGALGVVIITIYAWFASGAIPLTG